MRAMALLLFWSPFCKNLSLLKKASLSPPRFIQPRPSATFCILHCIKVSYACPYFSFSRTFNVHPDTEGILSVKQRLKEQACKDNILLSNLDFSEFVFRHNPLNNDVTLQVIGQWMVLRIGIVDSVIYTVSSKDGQTRIDCCVYSDHEFITDDDVKSIHFSMHSCQNQSRSCFTEAKSAVRFNHKALKITCNKFSITYTTHGIPDKIEMIETKCQFNISYITAERLLERKCWMQKEKTNCHELIACLNYVIEKYLTMPAAPKQNCRFILQGNNEMAEIISDIPNKLNRKQYIVMCGKFSEVSMYPPLD